MAVKQTAGREALGAFAPKFAELNHLCDISGLATGESFMLDTSVLS